MTNAQPLPSPSSSGARRALSLLAGGVCVLASGWAHAGVTMVTQRGAASPATLYIDGNRMRIDGADKSGQTTSVIIDGQTKKMIMVQDKDKTYVEMTPEDMKRMRAQVDAMRAQMEERMKTMPPDQRRKMEAVMAGMGAPGQPPKPPVLKFEKAGGKKSINGFSCEMYKVSKDGTPAEEDCIASWSSSTVQKSDLAALRKFGEEMMKNFGGMGQSNELALDQIDKYPGIPISRVPLEAGGARGEEEQIKSIKRGSIAGDKFSIPAGFTKKELPMGARPGGPPKGNFRPMPSAQP